MTTDSNNAQILIVDDTATNLSVLRNMLEAEGYSIAVAASGERALSIIPRLQPDLILLDIMMPGIDGIEVCRQLKASEATQAIPVIFVTAKTAVDDLVSGFNVGGLDYINKPFHSEEVRVRVRTVLQNQQLKREHSAMFEVQKKQYEQIHSILENVANGIATVDESGHILYINPAAEHLFGYAAHELIGQAFLTLISTPYQQACAEYFAHKKNALGQKPCEVVGQRKDGSQFEFDLSFTEIGSDEPQYIGVMHDISEHKQVERDLHTLCETDALTQIANRRRFDDMLAFEWKRGRRTHDAIALMLIDIDFFKQYNDTYGHQAGDACLAAIATTISDSVKRSTDLSARYGGEEFAVILTRSDSASALKIAHAICANITALAIPHEHSQAAPYVTVSIGLTVMVPELRQSVAEFIQVADRFLYTAKRSGRNQVAFSHESPLAHSA